MLEFYYHAELVQWLAQHPFHVAVRMQVINSYGITKYRLYYAIGV